MLALWCIPLSALGCDGNGEGEAGDSSSNDTTPDPATCEIASTTELADADAVAPNGRTGAEILAAIPESFQTTLNWDLSTSKVEVEVPGATGPSSTLNLTFTLPPIRNFISRIESPHPAATRVSR